MSSSILSKIGFGLPSQLSSSLYSEEYVQIAPQNAPNSTGYFPGQAYVGDTDVIFDITGASDMLLDAAASSLAFQGVVRSEFNNDVHLLPNVPGIAPDPRFLPMFCSGIPITKVSDSVNGGSIRVGEIPTNFSRYSTSRLLCSSGELLPQQTFEKGSSIQPTVVVTTGTAPTYTLSSDRCPSMMSYVNEGLTLTSFHGCNITPWTVRTQCIDTKMNVDTVGAKNFASNSGGLPYEVPLPLLCPLFDTNHYIPVNFLAQTTGSSGVRILIRFAGASASNFGPSVASTIIGPDSGPYDPAKITSLNCYYRNVRMILKFVRIKDPDLMASLVAMYNQAPALLPDGQMVPPMGRITIPFKNVYTFENTLLTNAIRGDFTYNISQKSLLGMLMRFRNPTHIASSGGYEKNLIDTVPHISSFLIELGNDSTIPLTSVTSEVLGGSSTATDSAFQCNGIFGAMYRAARHLFEIEPQSTAGGYGALSRFYTINPKVGYGTSSSNQFDSRLSPALDYLSSEDSPYMIAVSFENFTQKASDIAEGENHARGLNTWVKNGVITVHMQFSKAVAADTIVETTFIYNDILLVARGTISSAGQEFLH